MRAKPGQRRQQILEVLAAMLESNPGERLTTAALAAEVGVTEAALYRHFPSKGKMFEGLFEFAEESLFSRLNRILADFPNAADRLRQSTGLVLIFAERNPGICRLLTGDILVGEVPRLRTRAGQVMERLETHFRQVLRDAEINEQWHGTQITAPSLAALLMNGLEGRLQRFVRSDFALRPTERWEEHVTFLIHANGLATKI